MMLNIQKYLDMLAETNYTYFKVGDNWTYHSYEFISIDDVNDPGQILVPQFLIPYQNRLGKNECGITRTKRGDLIIYDKRGLLASYRKGSWKIYKATSLKNTLIKICKNNHWMGTNLYPILFDLSYRRHGALIIIDQKDNYKEFINNEQSLLNNSKGTPLHQALSRRLGQIDLKSKDAVSKPLLLELASIDGAIVFNKKGKLVAFGAMIKSHSNSNSEQGARSSAALSAFHYGALPFKVSSDGEIVCLLDSTLHQNAQELLKVNYY
ncbi:hypothetical protein GNP93_14895 [Paenibacillus validus]|uniref:DAC domain-containing protein n=2 Tax=Paenibacillus validus TaxID=44253 RepID=A0A7X2ZD65_9BACL|nr:hypothetical protein [Paenibacillus validus]